MRLGGSADRALTWCIHLRAGGGCGSKDVRVNDARMHCGPAR